MNINFLSRNKAILSILVLAFILRVWGINFGLPDIHPHPDESLTISKILGTVDKKQHDLHFLSPFHDFLKISLWGLNSTRKIFGYSPFTTDVDVDTSSLYLFGRFVTASISTLSVLFLYLISRQIFNRRVALLSALIFSLTFTDVQIGHYLKQDIYIQFLCLLIFWLMSKFVFNERHRFLYLAAAVLGIAAAVKLNALVMGIVFVFIFVHQLIKSKKRAEDFFPLILKFLPCLFLVFLFFTLSFWRITFNKDAFRLWGEFLIHIRRSSFPGSIGQPEASTIDGIPSFIWWFFYLFLVAYNPLLFLSVIGGIIIAAKNYLLQFEPKQKFLLLAILGFIIFYLAILFIKQVHYGRFILLVSPFFAIFAAVFWDKLLEFARSHYQKLIYIIFVFTFALSFFKIVVFDYLISLKDTRVLAIEEIKTLIPPKSIIVVSPFSSNLAGLLQKEQKYTSGLMPEAMFNLKPSDFKKGIYFVVSSTGLSTAKNYQELNKYKKIYSFFSDLENEAELIATISYFLFDKQFFSPHFLEQGATVNNYHNPTIKIYRIN